MCNMCHDSLIHHVMTRSYVIRAVTDSHVSLIYIYNYIYINIYITSFYMCHDSLISNVKNSSQYMCAGMHVSSQVLQVTIVKLDAIRAMRIRTNPSNTS